MQVNELEMLKRVTRESVKEAIKEERYALYDSVIPHVSAKEQREIESLHGSPDNYDENEFEDVTAWVLD